MRMPPPLPILGRGARTVGACGGLVLAGEALWAVLRPTPRFEGFDASVEVGDPTAPPLRLVVLGDSTTTGTGLVDPDDIWVRVLARRVALRHRVRVTSFAVNGARAVDVRREQLPRALTERHDVAFVSVGGNDALKGVPVRAFERHLDAIVADLSACADLVVVSGVGDLATIPRLLPPLAALIQARGRRFDAAHARVAERHGALKAEQWGTAAQAFRTLPGMFSPDLFHPAAAGHAVWAEVAWEVLAPRLGLLDAAV